MNEQTIAQLESELASAEEYMNRQHAILESHLRSVDGEYLLNNINASRADYAACVKRLEEAKKAAEPYTVAIISIDQQDIEPLLSPGMTPQTINAIMDDFSLFLMDADGLNSEFREQLAQRLAEYKED